MIARIVVIDGEHYPPVVRDAIAGVPGAVGALLVGALGEKLRSAPSASAYGIEHLVVASASPERDLMSMLTATGAREVVDLGDEPALGDAVRMRLAAAATSCGASYTAADFFLSPTVEVDYEHPSIGVVGTAKRIGKTAVAGALARHAASRLGRANVVVVAMGRGGPASPVAVDPSVTPIGLGELVALARSGTHAASDYLEDAVLTGVPTIGARRCGAGPTGAVAVSNVASASRLAAARAPALTIFEGSGAARPPVRVDRTLLVVPADIEPARICDGFGIARLLRADAILALGDGDIEALRAAVEGSFPRPVVAARLRASATIPIEGRRVVVFTTASPKGAEAIAAALREQGAHVADVSTALGRRDELGADLDAAASDAAWLVEIKAAGIDTVASIAVERGVEVGFLRHDVVGANAGDDVARLFDRLVDDARAPGDYPELS